MKHALVLLVCVAQIVAVARAQITISTGERAESRRSQAPPPSIKDLPKLVEQLRSDREWWGAYRKLVQLAEGEHETEVMEATVALWQACKDEAVRERTFLIPARLNRRTHFRQRREALDEEIAGIKRLTTRLNGELEKLGDSAAARDLRTTADELELKIARLKKTVADFDLQDPEFGAPHDLTLQLGGEESDEPAEKPAEKPKEAPASRPADKKPDGPRDDRGVRNDDRARKSGDLRRVAWVRPFKDALAKARETGLVLLVKPLMGGSNLPDEDGTPCGGKRDCEGSW